MGFRDSNLYLFKSTTDLNNICSVAAGSCFWAVSNVALVFVWYFQKFLCVLLKVVLPLTSVPVMELLLLCDWGTYWAAVCCGRGSVMTAGLMLGG